MMTIGEKIVKEFKTKNAGGIMAVVFEEGQENNAKDVVNSLAQANFTVKNQNLAVQNDFDDVLELAKRLEGVRLIIAVGGERAAFAAKAAASVVRADTAVAVTVFDGAGVFDNTVEFCRKNLKKRAKTPKFTVISDNVRMDKSKIYASLFYKLVRMIDAAFEGLDAKKDGFDKLLFQKIADVLTSDNLESKRVEEIFSEIAKGEQFESYAVPNYVTAKEDTDFYENCFLSAAMILETYKSFLKLQYIDLLPPPDFIKSFKLLDKNAKWDYNITLSEGEFLQADEFLKKRFLLKEYSEDLYRLAAEIDFEKIAKNWRRSFRDAGFHLQNHPTGRSLVGALSVAAACDNGLLLHIKRSGFFENNI